VHAEQEQCPCKLWQYLLTVAVCPDSCSWLPGYFKAIARIAAKERAKLYIPVSAPTTAIYDSLTQDVLPKDCVCWTLPPYLTGRLDDKTAFTDLCNKVRRLWIFSL